MQKVDEAKVLESLYDRLFDAITYTPSTTGGVPPFRKQNTFIQPAKNIVLNPDDFYHMLDPGNPNGDQTKAELFSKLVDDLPQVTPQWVSSGKTVSNVYSTIVNGANTSLVTDPNQQKIYDQAYKFLNVESTITDFTGATSTVTNPSNIKVAYDNNFGAYMAAVCGYRTAYNNYDLTKVADQRAWAAVQPSLQYNVTHAYDTWNAQGRAQVEQAQNALLTTINHAVSAVIAEDKKLIDSMHKLPSSVMSGEPWLPSYALPTNWYTPTSTASKLTLASSFLNQTASAESTAYAASASGSYGLFHARSSVSGGSTETHAHMDASEFKLEAELITVQIKRPWYNPLLFNMSSWKVDGVKQQGISSGKLPPMGDNAHLMALVPTGFVVARNVKITANFTQEDKSFIETHMSTEASGGWGPFSFSGSYSHSKSNSTFTSKFNGGTLEMPGLQLVAWINTVTPASPPEA